MSLKDFLRHFIVNATLALGAWYAAALALERIVPGFVSPFVNLPGIGLVLLAFAVLSLAVVPRQGSRFSAVVSLVLLAIILGFACLFLWSRINGLGGLGLLLGAASALGAILLCISFWPKADES
ncbi:MAG: hypothetical protein WA001_03245 [Patescibacteria group bacterium]